MIFELNNEDKKKILSLILNTKHELSIEAAVNGYAPAEVFVDNAENPKSGLFKGDECNLLFGDPALAADDFCWKIFEKIDYYEQVTCDNKGWSRLVEKHHSNRAIKPYTRYSYILTKKEYTMTGTESPSTGVQLLDAQNIGSLEYENSELAKEWACIHTLESLPGLKLAAVVIVDNTVVSCSGVDCYYDNKVEIGINTVKEYRGKGYGYLAVNELVKALFDYGIEQIGWHCVSTNKGSQRIAEKIGFKKLCAYTAYTPYPPIENISNLSIHEWKENAEFYTAKANEDPVQNWIAAQCWAKAGEMDKVLNCFDILAGSGNKWFLDCLDELEEFDKWACDEVWNNKLKELSTYEG